MATALVFYLFLAATLTQESHVRANVFPNFSFLGRLNDPHIISGKDAKPAQIPYHARIIKYKGGFFSRKKIVCGGSLISDTWVLTAAHCIEDHNGLQVSLGVHDYAKSDEPGRRVYGPCTGIMHEHYDPKFLYNDIGLIKLPEPVPFSERIQPIPLVPLSFKDKNLAGLKVRISGWGKTSDNYTKSRPTTLRYDDLYTISRLQCLETFSDITKEVLCATDHHNGGACHGDSGGPLVTRLNGKDVLVGTLSFVSTTGCAGKPSGYTNIAYYRHWIAEKTGIEYLKGMDTES